MAPSPGKPTFGSPSFWKAEVYLPAMWHWSTLPPPPPHTHTGHQHSFERNTYRHTNPEDWPPSLPPWVQVGSFQKCTRVKKTEKRERRKHNEGYFHQPARHQSRIYFSVYCWVLNAQPPPFVSALELAIVRVHHLYWKPPRPQGHSHPPGLLWVPGASYSLLIPRETIPPQVALQGSYLSPVVSAKPSVLLLPGSVMEARKSVSLVYNQSSDLSQSRAQRSRKSKNCPLSSTLQEHPGSGTMALSSSPDSATCVILILSSSSRLPRWAGWPHSPTCHSGWVCRFHG